MGTSVPPPPRSRLAMIISRAKVREKVLQFYIRKYGKKEGKGQAQYFLNMLYSGRIIRESKTRTRRR